MIPRNKYRGVLRRLREAAVPIILAAALFGCAGRASDTPEPKSATIAEHQQTAHAEPGSGLRVPLALMAEHEELHRQLEAAVKSGGRTAEAARAVEERLSSHFEKEEQYALPQLGLLVPLSEGGSSADANRAIELSDKLKAEMSKMLAEHRGIVEALGKLKEAAEAEKKPEAAHFAEALAAHAQNEEQITYPAAIIVGEYLKLKSKP